MRLSVILASAAAVTVLATLGAAGGEGNLVTGPTGNETMVYRVGEGKWQGLKGGEIELPNGYCHYNPELDLVTLNIHLKCFKLRYEPKAPAAPAAPAAK